MGANYRHSTKGHQVQVPEASQNCQPTNLTGIGHKVRSDLHLPQRPVHEVLDNISEAGTVESNRQPPPETRPPAKPVNRGIQCHKCGYRGHLAAQCRTRPENCRYGMRYAPYGKGGKGGKGHGLGGKGKGTGHQQSQGGGPIYNLYFGSW